MTSDACAAWARWRPHAASDGSGAWVCSTLFARPLDRNAAITAMTLVKAEGPGADVRGWRAELGI